MKIGYENLFETVGAAISATSEAAGFPKENAFDWLTFDWWKASAAGTVYLTVDLLSAKSVDYFALFAHDLHNNSGTVQLQWSTDNFSGSINSIGSNHTPSDSRPIFESFASQSARYWRLKVVSTGAASLLGCAAFGAMLDMAKNAQIGFRPPLGDVVDGNSQRAVKGAFLGRSVNIRASDLEFSFKGLQDAFIRSSWQPFREHAEAKPFFVSWDEDGHSDEAAFCWVEDGVVPQAAYSHSTKMTATNLKLKALTR